MVDLSIVMLVYPFVKLMKLVQISQQLGVYAIELS